jgi:RNA polymerase sigma-70 factor (ECF subfamily)
MRLAELSDDELLAEYRRTTGEARGAFADELFGRYYGEVSRWCYRFTGSRDAAADLAQDVFLKAHQHLESFRGEARFSSWLYGIVRNESLNRRRRAAPLMADPEVLANLPGSTASPGEILERDSRRRRLMEFLSSTLDETERLVFTLHYGDGMSLETLTRLLRLRNASGAKAFIVSAKRKLARATRHRRRKWELI